MTTTPPDHHDLQVNRLRVETEVVVAQVTASIERGSRLRWTYADNLRAKASTYLQSAFSHLSPTKVTSTSDVSVRWLLVKACIPGLRRSQKSFIHVVHDIALEPEGAEHDGLDLPSPSSLSDDDDLVTAIFGDAATAERVRRGLTQLLVEDKAEDFVIVAAYLEIGEQEGLVRLAEKTHEYLRTTRPTITHEAVHRTLYNFCNRCAQLPYADDGEMTA